MSPEAMLRDLHRRIQTVRVGKHEGIYYCHIDCHASYGFSAADAIRNAWRHLNA